jgi:hypothetical protein
MANKLEGYESVTVGEVSYLFKGDLSNMSSFKNASGIDPMVAFTVMNNGEYDPDIIKHICSACIVSVNGVDVDDGIKHGTEFVNAAGLQLGALITQKMLLYSLIGDVKKSQLLTLEAIRGEIEAVWDFRSQTLKSRLLLWAYRVAIFGALACSSFSLYVLHIS